jgi:uncharacterized protein (TIGR03435 family)
MLRSSALSILAAAAFSPAFAQPATERPEFDVASVKMVTEGGKPAAYGAGSDSRVDPGRLDFTNSTLFSLVAWAFRLKSYQVVWVSPPGFATYHVLAKYPPETTLAMRQAMMRSLLEDRFKLQFHREARETDAYIMTVAKGGLKMKALQPVYDEKNPPTAGFNSQTGDRTVKGSMSISQLIGFVGGSLDRPLVDQTELTDHYQINLIWTAARMGGGGGGGDDVGTASTPTGGSGASLFSALEKQLGLKVEARKTKIEILVIDHVERVPTSN